MWTSKLKSHYQRLMHQRRVEGLMRWRRCALALYQGGVVFSLKPTQHTFFRFSYHHFFQLGSRQAAFRRRAELYPARGNCPTSCLCSCPSSACWGSRSFTSCQTLRSFGVSVRTITATSFQRGHAGTMFWPRKLQSWTPCWT